MINTFNEYYCLCGLFLFNERDCEYDFESTKVDSYFLFRSKDIPNHKIGNLIFCINCEGSLGEAVWDSEEFQEIYIIKLWKESIDKVENLNYY